MDAFAQVVELLRHRRTAGDAVPIALIAEHLGLSRRKTEQLLETRYPDFPFPVVSCDGGYYRPCASADLNRYRASLHSRIVALALRLRTLRKSAAAAGFRYDRGAFADSPAQSDLPF